MQEVPGAGLGAGSWDEAELSTESVGVMPQESAFSVTSTFVSELLGWAYADCRTGACCWMNNQLANPADITDLTISTEGVGTS